MPAQDWRPILSNAFASGSNGRNRRSAIFAYSREHGAHPSRRTGGERPPRKQTEVTVKHSAEFPNMAQRAVMQYLSLDDWKIAARLPIPAGELMLSRIRNYGWIEIRGEKHHTAIKLTPAGLKAMRSAI